MAADCKGHGVPGAFMSMLGRSYLDEIVQRREITQANQVLNELRNQIKHSLRQQGQMDESRNVNGKPELKETKAAPMPLGYYQGKDKSFTNHSIPLEMGVTFYIFSDGYIDLKEILDKTLTDWMGNNSQMDEVLVIGVRV